MKDLPPGTCGGRSQCCLFSSQRRLILLVACLAVISFNTTSHWFALPDMPLADTVVSSNEGLQSHCSWSLSFVSLLFYFKFKVRQGVEQKKPGNSWMGKCFIALANVREKLGQLSSRNHLWLLKWEHLNQWEWNISVLIEPNKQTNTK